MGGGNSVGAEGEARKNCGGQRSEGSETFSRGEATRYRTLRVRYSLRIKNHPDPKAQAMEG